MADTVRDAARSIGTTPRVIVDGPVESRIADEVRVELLPTLREALSNVARHARATAVTVELAVRHDEVVLEIRDDGVGIPAEHRSGDGLRNMAQRAARLGGSCTVAAAGAEGGTVVRWVVPVRLGA